MFTSFRYKLFIILSLITIFLSGVSIYFLYVISIKEQLEGLRSKVISIASTAAIMVDGDEHRKLDPHKPVLTEYYKKLNFLLSQVQKENPDIRFVYTLTETENLDVCYIVADGDYPNLEVWPEEQIEKADYDVSNIPELTSKKAFKEPVATEKFYRDEQGLWLSGYAPVKDRSGKTAAVVGVDMSVDRIMNYQSYIKIWAISIFFFDIILSFILSYFISTRITHPLVQITRHTKVISEGNFKKIKDIKARDEIKVMADSFNDMIDKLDFLFLELKQTQADLKDAYLDTIFRLAVAAEYKDEVTSEHLQRVSAYAVIIARKLGLPDEDIENIKYAAPMHDIGKIGVPDKILLKEGKLTDEEYKIIKQHTLIGYDILKSSDSPYLKAAAVISLTHHECYDGSGYPEGRKGGEIHIYGRVVSLADVLDALLSKRPYKKPFTLEETVDMIKKDSGTKFDPEVVRAFLASLEEIKEYIKTL